MNTTSIKDKEFKVNTSQLADFSKRTKDSLLPIMPRLLGAEELRKLIHWWYEAKKHNKHVAVMCGGHVIKSGCGPLLVELIKAGYISSLHVNGAFAIHDLELSLFGKTSEDVDTNLVNGTFGNHRETTNIFIDAYANAYELNIPLGNAIGLEILPHQHEISPLATSVDRIYATIHSAFGADIIHMQMKSGCTYGEVTLGDFNYLVDEFKKLNNGGLLINIGSAVIMPEVALKAVALLRNKDPEFGNFNSVNLDMNSQYRSNTQVLHRFSLLGGQSASIIGQHEILLPLVVNELL